MGPVCFESCHQTSDPRVVILTWTPDWGDYRSFVRKMKLKAQTYGVDLLLIDTGDLHDGNGLSDATTPDGKTSNSIFQTVPMDLLTIGNHELYLTDVAQLTARQFATYYGDKYLTSNVKIYSAANGGFDFIGAPYRYFTTDHGEYHFRARCLKVLIQYRHSHHEFWCFVQFPGQFKHQPGHPSCYSNQPDVVSASSKL